MCGGCCGGSPIENYIKDKSNKIIKYCGIEGVSVFFDIDRILNET